MGKIYKEVGEINKIDFPNHHIKYFGELGKTLLSEEEIPNILIEFDSEFDFFESYPNISISVFIYTTYERQFVKMVDSYEDIRGIRGNRLEIELKKPLSMDQEFIIKVLYNVINDDNSISTVLENHMEYKFGYYGKNDKYLMIVEPVKKPMMTFGGMTETLNSALTNQTIILEKKTNVVTLEKFIGNLIVSVDGIVLTENYDFSRKDDLLIFNDKLPLGTVINIMGSKAANSDSGLRSEAYNVLTNTAIPLEETVVEGVFYNENMDKFGVVVESPINKTTTPIVILNGQILSSELDYYVSETNSSMIYLKGTLLGGDLIVVSYIPEFSTNAIDGSKLIVYGFLAEAPKNDSGEIIVMLSKDKNFNNHNMYILGYKKGVTVYDFNISYTDSSGVHYIKLVDRKEIIRFDNEKIPFTNETEAIKINFK